MRCRRSRRYRTIYKYIMGQGVWFPSPAGKWGQIPKGLKRPSRCCPAGLPTRPATSGLRQLPRCLEWVDHCWARRPRSPRSRHPDRRMEGTDLSAILKTDISRPIITWWKMTSAGSRWDAGIGCSPDIQTGAHAAATPYCLVATARACGFDPYQYPRFL